MLAVLYDVHGNLHALQAVLRDARTAGVDRFVLGGDYAHWGPFPEEAVATLQRLQNAVWIRGNVERWSAHPDDAPQILRDAIAVYSDALGPELVRELGALPEQAVVDGVRYCHASPLSDGRSFAAEVIDGDDERIPSVMANASFDRELLAGARERRVVFGHTHVQFRRLGLGGVELVNPGSVGMPLDGDRRAAYALVTEDGEVELRRVEYDHEAAVDELERRFTGAPGTDISLARLRDAAIGLNDPLRRHAAHFARRSTEGRRATPR